MTTAAAQGDKYILDTRTPPSRQKPLPQTIPGPAVRGIRCPPKAAHSIDQVLRNPQPTLPCLSIPGPLSWDSGSAFPILPRPSRSTQTVPTGRWPWPRPLPPALPMSSGPELGTLCLHVEGPDYRKVSKCYSYSPRSGYWGQSREAGTSCLLVPA